MCAANRTSIQKEKKVAVNKLINMCQKPVVLGPFFTNITVQLLISDSPVPKRHITAHFFLCHLT